MEALIDLGARAASVAHERLLRHKAHRYLQTMRLNNLGDIAVMNRVGQRRAVIEIGMVIRLELVRFAIFPYFNDSPLCSILKPYGREFLDLHGTPHLFLFDT